MIIQILIAVSSVTFAPVYPPIEGIESLEKEIFKLTNMERVDAGLTPLQYDERLCLAAKQHSYEMGKLHYFAHQSPVEENKNPFQRVYRSGCSEMMVGENIYKEYGFSNEGLAKMVMEGWMNSPGHRANILRKEFTHIGVGVVASGDTFYFTQVFVNREVYTYGLSIEDALGKYFLKMLVYTEKSDKIVLVVNDKVYKTFNTNQAGAVQIEIPFNRNDGVKKIQWGYQEKDRYWLTNEIMIDTDKSLRSIFTSSR